MEYKHILPSTTSPKQHQSSWELPKLRASGTIQYFAHTAHETLPSRLQLLTSNVIIISVVLVRKLRLSSSQSYKKSTSPKAAVQSRAAHSKPNAAPLYARALKVLIGTAMIVLLREPQKPGQADSDT